MIDIQDFIILGCVGGCMSDNVQSPQGYASDEVTHGGYGMPRGPICRVRREDGELPDTRPYSRCAIGFCPMCGTNSRGTCSNRGVFECHECPFFWFDYRVGEQTRSIDDFFTTA